MFNIKPSSETNNNFNVNNCGDCELCTQLVDNRRVRIQSMEIAAIETIIDSHILVEKNQTIYESGQTFQNLYTVHSGMFKSVYTTQQGDERIVDVFIPGQIMGFDGIHGGHYKTTIKSLSSGSYCVIPYYPLQELAMKHRDIQNRLMKMMSAKIFQFEVTNSEYTAKQKLISIVKEISELYYSRGFSAKQFPFQISQRDLANYLGLAEETLSRAFSQLKKQDIMVLANQQITILDEQKFSEIIE